MASTAPTFVARALLSDLDGTLVDTEPLYYEAYRATMEKLGHAYPEAFHVEHLHGREERAGAATIVREFGLTQTADELLAARDEILEPSFATVPPCRGAARAVAALRGALPRGAFAVATSSKERLVAVKRASAPVDALLADFAHVVCSDSPLMAGRAKKPAFDTFLVAAALVGVAPADCLVFEDSLAGIRAGAAAGCFVIAITDRRLAPGAAEAAGARIVLESLDDFTLASVGL